MTSCEMNNDDAVTNEGAFAAANKPSGNGPQTAYEPTEIDTHTTQPKVDNVIKLVTTPLKGNSDVVELLLENGAYHRAKNNDGVLAEDVAYENGKMAVAEVLSDFRTKALGLCLDDNIATRHRFANDGNGIFSENSSTCDMIQEIIPMKEIIQSLGRPSRDGNQELTASQMENFITTVTKHGDTIPSITDELEKNKSEDCTYRIGIESEISPGNFKLVPACDLNIRRSDNQEGDAKTQKSHADTDPKPLRAKFLLVNKGPFCKAFLQMDDNMWYYLPIKSDFANPSCQVSIIHKGGKRAMLVLNPQDRGRYCRFAALPVEIIEWFYNQETQTRCVSDVPYFKINFTTLGFEDAECKTSIISLPYNMLRAISRFLTFLFYMGDKEQNLPSQLEFVKRSGNSYLLLSTSYAWKYGFAFIVKTSDVKFLLERQQHESAQQKDELRMALCHGLTSVHPADVEVCWDISKKRFLKDAVIKKTILKVLDELFLKSYRSEFPDETEGASAY